MEEPPAVAMLVLFLAVMIGQAVWIFRPILTPSPPPAIHAEVVLEGLRPLNTLWYYAFVLSPDAHSLVYDLNVYESPMRLRRLDYRKDVELQGTEKGSMPFYSPDGKTIGFYSGKRLLRMTLDGGNPIQILDGLLGKPAGVSWSENGDIVYGGGFATVLMRVSENGGDPTPLTTLGDDEFSHRWPQCLPGGTDVLFAVLSNENKDDQSSGGIALADIATGKHVLLPPPLSKGCSFPRYAKSGHLVYIKDLILYAVPFDLNKRKVNGEPYPVVNGISPTKAGAAQYGISTDGTFVYLPGKATLDNKRTMVWIGLDGEITSTGMGGDWNDIDLSPDDKHVAVTQVSERKVRDTNIWIVDLDRSLSRRLTNNESVDSSPKWSPDGKWIFFAWEKDGTRGISKIRTDFSGDQREIMLMAEGHGLVLEAPSADLRHLPYAEVSGTSGWDLWSHSLQEGNAQPSLIKNSSGMDLWPVVSPNGKWIAYGSQESTSMQLYVKLFNVAGGDQQVTSQGGSRPRWSSKSDRIFYSHVSGGNESIWSVALSIRQDELEPGISEKFLSLPHNSQIFQWDMASDDERILVLVEGDYEERPVSPTLHIISNWFTELNDLVPLGEE